jgi:hypothetical protein
MDPVAPSDLQAPDPQALVVPLEQVGLVDIPRVGGKNASLGEMIRELTDRLNSPTPAATLELQQTQALDPLERQRQRLAGA